MPDRDSLPAVRLIALSLPSAAFAGYELARRSYLAPYLTGHLSMGLPIVGAIVMLANLASIPAELIVGALSDQGLARLGRRRLWMISGTALVLLSTTALLAPGGVSPVWFVAGLVALGVGWAMCNVTHGAWALEIVADSRVRGRIFGMRTVFGIVGAIGFSALATVAAPFRGSPFATIMATVALVALVLHGALVALVPDRGAPRARWKWAELLDPLSLLAANRANLRLAALFALNGAHAAITGIGYFYAVDNGLRLRGWAPFGILVQMICASIGVLAVMRFGSRMSAVTLLKAVLWANLILAIAFPLLPPGKPLFLMLWSLPFGLISAIDFMALRMMLGERLDVSAMASERAAAHYAGFHLPFNLCGAITSGLLFAEYHALGFDPRTASATEQVFAPVLLIPSLAAAAMMAVSLWILAAQEGCSSAVQGRGLRAQL